MHSCPHTYSIYIHTHHLQHFSSGHKFCWLCCQEAAKWCLHQLIPLCHFWVWPLIPLRMLCVCWKHFCHDIRYICAVGVLRRERKRTNWRPGYKCSLSLSYHFLGIWFIMADGHWTGTVGVAMATQLRRTEHPRLEREQCLSPTGDAGSHLGKRSHSHMYEHVLILRDVSCKVSKSLCKELKRILYSLSWHFQENW